MKETLFSLQTQNVPAALFDSRSGSLIDATESFRTTFQGVESVEALNDLIRYSKDIVLPPYDNLVLLDDHGKEGAYFLHLFEKGNECIYSLYPAEHIASDMNAMQERGTIDALTQAYNKQTILDFLEIELANAQRYGVDLRLIIFDIDHFKQVNDTYGHLAGDAVLRDLGDTTRRTIREGDIFGRYGGEEFFLILPHTKAVNGMSAAERLRKRVEETIFSYEGTVIPVTISLGITGFSPKDNIESLIKRADDALYQAKQSGRNRVEFK